MQKIPKTTAFPFILTLISRISYTRFIFFPFARNLILQSRIYLCKVDFTFSIHQKKERIPSSDNSFLFFLFYYLFIIPDGTLLHIPHSQFNCSPSGNTPPSSTMFARSIIFCTEDSTGSIIKSSVSPLE